MEILKADIKASAGSFKLDIDLCLEDGFGVLFGPSGAGKSLTLRYIAGLEKPVSGVIKLKGRTLYSSDDGTNIAPFRRRTAMVFQDLALFPNMTVAGNIRYAMKGDNQYRQLDGLLKIFKLDGLQERYPSELSGGQRQRTALARTFASEPELVLMDEPFSSLDLPLRRSLRREIKQYQSETGVPVIYVTHDVEDIFSMGKTVFFMNNGEISRRIETSELMNPDRAPELFQFLDIGTRITGRINFASGRVLLRWNGGCLFLPAVKVESAGLNDGDEAAVIIAPEDVKLLYPDIPVDPRLSGNSFTGRIVDSGFSNGLRTLHIESAGLLWQSVFGGRSYSNLIRGDFDEVSFGVDADRVILLPKS